MEVERLNVPLPAGFDPGRHGDALLSKINQAKGGGWRLQTIDSTANKAIFTRRAAVTSVATSASAPETFEVQLSVADSKPSAGDKVAAEQQATYPGFYLTTFDPHLGRARLTRLDDDTARCRGAVANALGCKPWDVQARPRKDGGFDLDLPKTYMPSKHNDKLEEVATSLVGRLGWRCVVDSNSLQAHFIPGEPPIFPKTVSYPVERLGHGDLDSTVFGVELPIAGEGVGAPVSIDWTASSWALAGGVPGSGKTVTLNALVAQQLADGASVVICDEKSKSVDFLWVKPYVRDGGWGCDSEAHTVAALGLVYEEGQRRSKILAEKGIVNWLDMPEGERFQPIFVVVDEVSALLVQDPVPKGVPKDNPIVVEINELNFKRALIGRYINKIVAEQRFVGIRMVLSTQVTNAATGLPPSLKNKIGHRILQGSNPSKPARAQSFNDEQSVPVVPDHVKASGAHARGVGVCDLEGQKPTVYKSLFALTSDYLEVIAGLGLPTSSRPEPTPEEVAKFAPDLEADPDASDADTPSGRPLDPRFGPVETFNEDGKKLFGAAAAASATKKLATVTVEADGPSCPACDSPIDPVTGRCRCD